MIALAIDTCFSQCAAGIITGGEGGARAVVIERAVMDTGHAEALLPMVERAAERARVNIGDIERIVVTIGPGTFTGVRTGIAAARGLALATGASIVPVSSLLAIAGSVLRSKKLGDGEGVIACADARKGQFYAQAIGDDGVEIGSAQVLGPDDIALLEPQRRMVLAGRGTASIIEAAGGSGRAFALNLALHSVHCDATFDGLPDLEFMLRDLADRPAADRPSPLYLRPPDAKPQADKSLPWSKP